MQINDRVGNFPLSYLIWHTIRKFLENKIINCVNNTSITKSHALSEASGMQS